MNDGMGCLSEGELRMVGSVLKVLLDFSSPEEFDRFVMRASLGRNGQKLTREGLRALSRTVALQAAGASGMFDRR